MIPLIYDATCSKTPRVMHGNWDDLATKGWRWDKNMSIAFQDSNLDYLHELQSEHGPDNVAVGFPFVIGEGPRSHNSTLVGVYLRTAKSIDEAAQDWPDTFPADWLTDGS